MYQSKSRIVIECYAACAFVAASCKSRISASLDSCVALLQCSLPYLKRSLRLAHFLTRKIGSIRFGASAANADRFDASGGQNASQGYCCALP
jgi:hypothetical protein